MGGVRFRIAMVTSCSCIPIQPIQVADLCVANDNHSSSECRPARRGSGGVGGRQQDTKVALYGLVNLFKVRKAVTMDTCLLPGYLSVVCVSTMQ